MAGNPILHCQEVGIHILMVVVNAGKVGIWQNVSVLLIQYPFPGQAGILESAVHHTGVYHQP